MESGIKDTGIRFDEGMEPREGPLARKIESVTSHLPSDAFLWASVGSMLVSLGLQLTGKRRSQHVSNFIGQWAPTLLILGLYNKLVKVAGHDRQSGSQIVGA